ncbi:diamine acetyltransferase 2 isoform X1 [Zootermopsis nevadensis]|uniref:diamine acetyltransferase 2 isoform X1 n=1 Tax=Zootermopsis nevadensis TaxID=136037 RepID=UPI000B8E638C|nr:diamine acetyltransferase 2 isoform X1 [Zootermopsis nevadensis]XP_021924207.1 diamine acetyltransferase 2 isoform X1 [Zootermopsis nevadensis]XP_021924208.1 diamine acetyltransferase 2 isoform X1 [Zootermopsis nevadensis]XP_021924209.1 diamine acetyltransferase 2 isoform X1 [Zootermopsis nevadensis]XP_021924210.1 diamine acetyltransferase 2 isoform X1 [Zootermopsis nevadensis]
MNGFTIREARREDCREIRRLIQELASYSQYPEDPAIETDILEEDGFNPEHPYFYCFVAERSLEDSGDAVVPNNSGEFSDIGACGSSNTGTSDDSNANILLGYALYYYTYSTWKGKALYLEDLYITPGCRGQGLGSAIFNRVAKRAFESRCSRLDFAVLNWNPARDFYKAKGAIDITEEEGWHHYRLDREALAKLALEVNKVNVNNE